MHAQQPFQPTLTAVASVERLETLQPPFCNDAMQYVGKLGTEEVLTRTWTHVLADLLSCKMQGGAKVKYSVVNMREIILVLSIINLLLFTLECRSSETLHIQACPKTRHT